MKYIINSITCFILDRPLNDLHITSCVKTSTESYKTSAQYTLQRISSKYANTTPASKMHHTIFVKVKRCNMFSLARGSKTKTGNSYSSQSPAEAKTCNTDLKVQTKQNNP